MPADVEAQKRRRVAIIGGGFGGLSAAKELAHANVDVTVIDRMNHHLFQPLLYQAATAQLTPAQCASPIREQLKHQKNTTVLMAEVTGIDVERRKLALDDGAQVTYDDLVVACGAQSSYFGNDAWKNVTFGLKTLDDAIALREQVFGAFEQAERIDDPQQRDEWMTFVVVGGGPTGVEIAGQLAILSRHGLKGQFRRIDPAQTKIILLDAGERVLPAFTPKLSGKAARELASLGVSPREGTRVTQIDRDGVTVQTKQGAQKLATHTVVWAAGVRAASLAETLSRATGAKTDRGGRLHVNPDLSLPGHPEISVIGDVAHYATGKDKTLPGLATVAIQQGRHVAHAIRSGRAGASTPFRYFDKGALAVVGRGRAICDIKGLKLWGPPAYFTYLGVHLFYLGGVLGRRGTVLFDWITSEFGIRQGRVMEHSLPASTPSSPSEHGIEQRAA